MPKKGKKKSAKLDKMTEEERILYLEQQRLAEEEMRKKKEDMLTQFLKDKLVKEEKASRFNLNKLNHQWRNIMREAKSKEMKKEIEILSQTFERVVDRKESVIKSLVKDLSEAEEQYAMALRSHLENVDNLINLQKQRLDTLNSEYRTELDVLKHEFDSERNLCLTQHNQEVGDLSDILFAMDQNIQDKENDAKSEFQSMRDEIKNKNLEEKHALRVQLESAVEDLWEQFQASLRNYNETTEDRKNAFETLKAKDEKSAEEIEIQMRKLQRISDNISQLRGKMASNSKEADERNKQLKEEREVMGAHFQDLKGQMNKLRDAERERLTKLTLESNSSIKELKRVSSKGERILRLAEMCRRLETEEEKVLPFYASTLTNEEKDDVQLAEKDSPSEPLADFMHEYSALENFWKRYNKVYLDKLALDKERQMLAGENTQLRSLLKQYLDGISVNDEILSQVNPLFVVNQKTNVNTFSKQVSVANFIENSENAKLNVPVMDPRIQRPGQTVVEAAHVVKHILRS